MTFQVTSHEGSVIISFATSIDLNLIQPHRDSDVVPEEGSLIYSKADMPVKQKNKKNSRNEHSHTVVSRVQKKNVNQCVSQEKKVETKSKQHCQAPVFYNKNCQAESVMQPVKPQMDVWLKKPTMSNKKQKKCEYDDSKSQVSKNFDRNCQEKENNAMWSVTKDTDDMWLPKLAVPYEYRRMCSDKNCQSTR